MSPELDVRPDAQVRKEGVVLEDEAGGTLLGRQLDSALGVEPGRAVDRDTAAGLGQPCDRSKQRRLARARRPDERNGLPPDGELYAEVELAERNVDSETKRVHPGSSLRARSTAAPKQTKSAPIASAVSKSTSNCA